MPAFPWKSYMAKRLQDREIRKFMDFALENAVYAAFGGMQLGAPPTGNYSLGAGWTKFTDFDSLVYANPRGVTVDLPNNRLAVTTQASYAVSIYFNMTHNESNQGRTTNIRLFNETDGTPGPTLPIAIGRNTPGTNFAIMPGFEVTPTEDNDWLSIELGGGGAVSGTFNAFQFMLFSVGPIQEQIDSFLQS